MTDSSTLHLVGVAIPTLRSLRTTVLASSEAGAAVGALREAGFAGGESIHAAFERWLAEAPDALETDEGGAPAADAGSLPLEQFSEYAARFFRDAGWGDVTFTQDESEGVAIVDIEDCWEAAGEGEVQGDGCHITTGLLAAFFGRLAGYPVAVLETECGAGDASRCRFLMGNPEVMGYLWERMQ